MSCRFNFCMQKILFNQEDYLQRVNDTAAKLPSDAIYLMSLDASFDREHKAGRISVVNPRLAKQAAEFIVNGYHRSATKEEIDAWEADQAEKRELAKLAAIDAKGIHIHPVMAQAPASEAKKK